MSQENVELVRRVYEAEARRDSEARAFNREWQEAFENIETSCEELIDAGEQVISVARYYVRGRESRIEVAGPAQAGVWTIRDGKVIRSVWFETREHALEAVGLREYDDGGILGGRCLRRTKIWLVLVTSGSTVRRSHRRRGFLTASSSTLGRTRTTRSIEGSTP